MSNKNLQNQPLGNTDNQQKKSYSKEEELVKIDILGIGITNETEKNILEFLLNSIKNTKENYYMVTPNPEMIVLSQRLKVFKDVLNGAKIALNDGVGVSWAARFMGMSLKQRITGTDFMKSLCEKVSDWPITVGFLGGGPKVAEKTAECLKSLYPGLKVIFAQEEWQQKQGASEKNQHKMDSKGQRAKQLRDYSNTPGYNGQPIDILFIAFGAPKQEVWMAEHINKIPVRAMIGVGGAFDFVSGKIPRAPKFIRSLGLEWLFRLILEPWRWRRQLALLEFIWLILKEKFLR